MSAKGRICLIDDEPLVRDALALGMSDLGFEVLTADNPGAGLDLIAKERPEAVVTDIMMPGVNGVEGIAAIRQQFPDIIIIAMSGGGQSGAQTYFEMALANGADECLQKPFRVAALQAALERAREKRTNA
jgi:DNA-binding response OmpR family regulator